MEKRYNLIFDEVMIKQLKSLGKDANIRYLISNMLDKIEILGDLAGKILDSQLHIYEIKNKHPPLRLYFKPIVNSNNMSPKEIYELLYKKSAYFIMKNTLGLKTKEFEEIKITTNTVDELEDTIIAEHSAQSQFSFIEKDKLRIIKSFLIINLHLPYKLCKVSIHLSLGSRH